MCVDKLDHHCFVLNNCIGEKNYHYFVSYLLLVTQNAFIVLVLSSFSLFKFNKILKSGTDMITKILSCPVRAMITFVISIITFVTIGYFFIFHLRLILYNQTGIEYKYKYHSENLEKVKKLGFCDKLKLTYKNLLNVIKSDSILDLYWPE
jgi:hypothetical protein